MAPSNKTRGKKPKKSIEIVQSDPSHVSPTDEDAEVAEKTRMTAANESEDAFDEADYDEPIRISKNLNEEQRKKVLKTKRLKPKTKTGGITDSKQRKKSSEDKLKKLQLQINDMQKIINTLSHSQIDRHDRGRKVGESAREAGQDDQENSDSISESGDSSLVEEKSCSDSDTSDSGDSLASPLKEHLEDITGGRDAIQPSNIPLHAYIDKKLKRKIWDLKYIDFAKLLDKDERPKNNKFTFEINDSKIQKVKSFEDNFQNFQLWDKAFSVYMSVHANNPKGVSPKLIDGLLQYRITLSEIARSNGNWSKYDIKFRKYVQNIGKAVFGMRIPDLYHQCLLDKKIKQYQNQNYRVKRNNFQKFCFKFNSGNCENKNCRYEHSCQKCKAVSHGSSKCNVSTNK